MKLFRPKVPKIGIALGSGAARGLAHIGVLKALQEAEIPVDMIAGTSMGAIVGACFARHGDISAVEEIALNTDRKLLARLLDLNLRSLRKGFIQGHRIEELLCSLIGDVDFTDLKIPFAAVATNVYTGQEVVINKGSVIEAVRASFSIPAIFVPVRSEDRCLVDGGLTNPVPSNILRDMGAKFTIAVNVLIEPHKRKPVNLSQKDMRPDMPDIFNTVIQSIYIMEYEIIKARIVKADLIISPEVGRIEAYEFYKAESAILAGYKAALNALPRLQKVAGKH